MQFDMYFDMYFNIPTKWKKDIPLKKRDKTKTYEKTIYSTICVIDDRPHRHAGPDPNNG